MNRLFRGLALAVAVLTGVAASPVRAAESDGVMKVEDAAGLFSAEGISKAKEAFQGTTFRSKTHYLIVTADKIPSAKQAEWDEIVKNKDNNGRDRFATEWARAMGRQKDSKGDVVTLVFRTHGGGPSFAMTVADRESDVYRHLGDDKAKKVSSVYVDAMKKTKGDKIGADEAKKEMDAALTAATELVINDLKDTSAPEPGHRNSGNHPVAAEKGGSGVGGWICLIACVLLGVWLVTALIRAFTGGGGGGGGYGGGGYGGGGGGGGGFFSSLLGGMFGAAAGMWMYNNFFGGSHYNNDAMAGDSYGNDGGTTDTGDGDYNNGSAGGDGDWGDSGGGDAGGGGDWGGSGDAGGGDWGGGGGDFGGGGGDFGGGGGDW